MTSGKYVVRAYLINYAGSYTSFNFSSLHAEGVLLVQRYQSIEINIDSCIECFFIEYSGWTVKRNKEGSTTPRRRV